MADRRGKHQSIHTALVDDLKFIGLTPEAKLVFYTLKLMLGATGIDVVRAHVVALAEVTGLEVEAVEGALRDLRSSGYLAVEGNVLWLPNGLRYNPALNLENVNHCKSVQTHLEGLPAVELVNSFAQRYGFNAIGDTIGDTIPDTIIDQEEETETEKEKENSRSLKRTRAELSMDRLMKVIRTVAHLDSERAEQMNSGSIAKLFSEYGQSYEDIELAVRNTREMVDAGLIGWLSPREPFSLKALRKPSGIDGSSQPLYTTALEWRRPSEGAPRANGLDRVKVVV